MYRYRLGQPADLPWLDQAVVASAWETLVEEQRRVLHPTASAQQAQAQLRQHLSMPGTALLMATAGGYPVGYLLVGVGPDSSTEEPTVHLLDLWVHPAHRRRKVASHLLRWNDQLAAAHGLQKVKLWTAVENWGAIALAERHGFKRAGLIGVKEL